MHNSYLTSYSNKYKKSYQTSKQCSAPNSLLATPSESPRFSKQMKKPESEVFSMHNSHLTSYSNKYKKSYQTSKQCSAPNSLLATPSESPRFSKQMKKLESESFNSNDVKYFKSKQTVSASTKQANLNNKSFRFEEHMPLCKVQNMLSKGQVVEVSH